MALAAAADHTPAREPPRLDAREGRSVGHAEPGAQEALARRGEDVAVVGAHRGEVDFGQGDDGGSAGVRGACRMARRARVADVAPGEREPGLAIVVLLCWDPVEPDQVPGEALHALRPHAPADAVAAPLGHHDVEADEAEAAVVRHGAQAARDPAIDFGDQEAVRVRRREAVRVVQARVPALACRELDREIDLVAAHRPDRAVARRIHSLSRPALQVSFHPVDTRGDPRPERFGHGRSVAGIGLEVDGPDDDGE